LESPDVQDLKVLALPSSANTDAGLADSAVFASMSKVDCFVKLRRGQGSKVRAIPGKELRVAARLRPQLARAGCLLLGSTASHPVRLYRGTSAQCCLEFRSRRCIAQTRVI
jgi:hypothetical protein